MKLIVMALLMGLITVGMGAGIEQKDPGDGKKILLPGDWDVVITVQGVENPKGEESKVLSFQETNGKILGKITIPNLTAAAAGFQMLGSRDLALTDLKYDGKSLSFAVGDEENSMLVELVNVSENEFTGTWRSPISGRWKGNKSEFRGTLKIVRKK